MPLNAQFSAGIIATLSNIGATVDQFGRINHVATVNLVPGTTDGQADVIYSAERSLAGSANENVDLSGVLADAFGAIVTPAKIKAILISADSGNNGDIVVGGAASNGFVGPFGAAAHTAAVRPGGAVAFFAPNTGWTVTNATGDLLKVANAGAGPGKYRITIVGTSA